MEKIAIIMGSDSDLKIMKEAAVIFEQFNIDYDIKVISAHRTPKLLENYVATFSENSVKAVIAGAGGAAHLAGVIAAMTIVPVIAVPIKLSALDGLDSLLSMVQMPSGIPVATMAINGATNAGLFAAQILGLNNQEVSQKLVDYKKSMEKKINEKNDKLTAMGYKKYLQEMI